MRGPQALRALEEAWRRDPAAVFVRLADAYRESARLEDAERVVERGLRDAPGHLAGRVVQARIRMDQGESDRPEAGLLAVLEDQPQHWGARRLLARLYRSQARWADEVTQLAELDRLHPGDSEVRAALRRASADRDYRPAVPAILPGTPAEASGASARGGAPWSDAGAPPIDERPPVPRIAPAEDPFQNATMAELLLGQGDLAGARRVYRQLLDREPGRESWRARLAELGEELPPAPPSRADEPLNPDLAAGLLDALVGPGAGS